MAKRKKHKWDCSFNNGGPKCTCSFREQRIEAIKALWSSRVDAQVNDYDDEGNPLAPEVVKLLEDQE